MNFTFWHIFEVSFDRKCVKLIDISISIMENQTVFIVFLLNLPIFEKNRIKMSSVFNFRIKVMIKW